MLPLLTGIGKFAKGALGKPKTPPKVNAKKFAGQVDRAKASSGAVPKGALVPSPGGDITKIVDVKVDKPEKTKILLLEKFKAFIYELLRFRRH